MKKLLIFSLTIFSFLPLFASHIVGGEVIYKFISVGSAPNTNKYQVSVRLFRDCNVACGGSTSVACLPTVAIVSVFQNISPYARVVNLNLPLDSSKTYSLTNYPPCITSYPSVCYEVKTYSTTVDLPINAVGYRLAYQNCCRASSFNVVADAGTTSGIPGATYEATMPGTDALATGSNSIAPFNLKDPALVCNSSPFTLDFGAVDAENDSLSYEFAGAYGGGNFTASADNMPAGAPPYVLVTYDVSNGFSATSPLGTQASINPATGVVSGISPANPGRYVVNVVVKEWRNGRVIAEHRKDLILRVEDCQFTQANLNPNTRSYCTDFTYKFVNGSTSSSIIGYHWDFGVAGIQSDTSNLATPSYTFPDTGIYVVRLTVFGGSGCYSADSLILGIYPGFNADFSTSGSCFKTPFQFADKTSTAYGVVSSWQWDFGDLTTSADTSHLKNPTYTYPDPGVRSAQLIVTSSKGCVDTVIKPITVKDIPLLTLPFKDTLICSIDSLPLIAVGTGNFSWTPNYNIINPTSGTPIVYPKTTTTYTVKLNESGCVASDSIKVNVLDFIKVDAGKDTSLCRTDSFTLRPTSQALKYVWTPATSLSNPLIKNPIASPSSTITYYVTANLGKCQDKDSINIKVAPYPKAAAGPDASICYGDRTILTANITGSSFSWSPTFWLQNPNSLTPIASPLVTTSYVLSAYDTVGCPKPFKDTVVVTVIPKIQAFAGRDTIIVINQPLQLNASGGTSYAWTPGTGMNNPNIGNPLVILAPTVDSIRYVVRATIGACFADDDILVRVFKTSPDIFVPSGFTPNGDGKNDVLKPILVGMKSLTYFKVFNRWGQMVFSTSEIGPGWDGSFGGLKQGTGTFVYLAEAIDYLNRKIFRKGTVVLIR